MESIATSGRHEPWNKGKIVGQKAPFKLKEIWALRVRLQMNNRVLPGPYGGDRPVSNLLPPLARGGTCQSRPFPAAGDGQLPGISSRRARAGVNRKVAPEAGPAQIGDPHSD